MIKKILINEYSDIESLDIPYYRDVYLLFLGMEKYILKRKSGLEFMDFEDDYMYLTRVLQDDDLINISSILERVYYLSLDGDLTMEILDEYFRIVNEKMLNTYYRNVNNFSKYISYNKKMSYVNHIDEDDIINRIENLQKNIYLKEKEKQIIRIIKMNFIPVEKEFLISYLGYSYVSPHLLRKEGIVNYSNSYYYINENSRDISVEKKLLESVISLIGNYGVCHMDIVHEELKKVYYEYFEKFYAFSSLAYFSLLRFMFRRKLNFSMPYVLLNTTTRFEQGSEYVENYIKKHKEITIDDIRSLRKQIKYTSKGILQFVNSLSQYYFLNVNTVIYVNMFQNKDLLDSNILFEAILNEIGNETIPISSLRCLKQFYFHVKDADEWYVYSLIRKNSSALEVAYTSSNLIYSMPLVAKKGYLSHRMIDYYSKYEEIVHICLQYNENDSYDDIVKNDIGIESFESGIDDLNNIELEITDDDLDLFL